MSELEDIKARAKDRRDDQTKLIGRLYCPNAEADLDRAIAIAEAEYLRAERWRNIPDDMFKVERDQARADVLKVRDIALLIDGYGDVALMMEAPGDVEKILALTEPYEAFRGPGVSKEG